MRFSLLLLILLNLPALGFEIGISESRTPPIATIFYTQHGPEIRKTGVIYLLGQYIARHTGEPTTFKVLSQKTMDNALATNQIESICYTNPSWINLPKGTVFFTKPFMSNNEFLVSRKTIPLIKKPSDLNQLTIGLIQNHHYPLLQNHIDKGLINTEYYQSETTAFISLFRANDLDAIVFKEVGFRHLMKSMPQIVGKENITIHPLSFGELQVSCALSPNNQHKLSIINNAIDEYISDQSL